MNGKATPSADLARVISRFTNPCILSVLVLLSIAYTESGNVRALVGWGTVVLLFLVVLPLVYVYMRISIGSGTRLLADPTIFLKQHPRDILFLGVLFGLPCLAILAFLEAPSLLLCTLVALLVGSLVVALFNVFYRVSYHLAAVTIVVIMATLTWGRILLVLLTVIPLVGWAKYRLHQHDAVQLATGVALAAAVIVTTLYLFG